MDQEIRRSFTIVEGGPPEPAPRSVTLGATFFALTFLVGLWLVVSPFVFGYGMVGARLTVHVNDVLAGTVVVVLCLVGMMAPQEAPWAGPALTAVGAWVAAASHLLTYRQETDTIPAMVNDLVVGCVIALLGGIATVLVTRK